MNMRRILTKVAGVTYEGRQDHLARCQTGTPIQLKPEPENKYDPQAIAVYAGIGWEDVPHVGYIPKDIAAEIAPAIEGETVVGRVFELTGGFEKWDGSRASYGRIIEFEIPDETMRDFDR